MSDERQTEQTEDRIHAVRWDREVFARLEQAADRWAEQAHLSISVADVIRTGAIRRAEETLGPAEPAQPAA